MTVHVSVTAEDIRLGIHGGCLGCPVALAIGRAIQPREAAVWSGGEVTLRNPPVRGSLQPTWLPAFVADRIDEFDQGGAMDPFEFDIEVPT